MPNLPLKSGVCSLWAFFCKNWMVTDGRKTRKANVMYVEIKFSIICSSFAVIDFNDMHTPTAVKR